jgi:hypothetical protein
MDEDMAEFVTVDMLNEQLAVVDHYLATIPITPFTTARRDMLQREQAQLQMLIQRKQHQEEDHPQPGSLASSSASESPSPAPSPQPAFTNSNSASASGFSTPDDWLSSSRDHNPFASVAETSLNLLPDDDRLAQEFA